MTFAPTLCAMERILLERLGIGWNDSVAEANEKRMKDRKVRKTKPPKKELTYPNYG